MAPQGTAWTALFKPPKSEAVFKSLLYIPSTIEMLLVTALDARLSRTSASIFSTPDPHPGEHSTCQAKAVVSQVE